MDTKDIILTPAERMYKSHLRNVANYQRKNPEKMKKKHQRYTLKRKNDPKRHQEYLQKRREYYKSVIRVRKKVKNEENDKTEQKV